MEVSRRDGREVEAHLGEASIRSSTESLHREKDLMSRGALDVLGVSFKAVTYEATYLAFSEWYSLRLAPSPLEDGVLSVSFYPTFPQLVSGYSRSSFSPSPPFPPR